eukprot:1713286-Pyramimonas_sp.AAC.1
MKVRSVRLSCVHEDVSKSTCLECVHGKFAKPCAYALVKNRKTIFRTPCRARESVRSLTGYLLSTRSQEARLALRSKSIASTP